MTTPHEMKCPSCDKMTRTKHMAMHLDGNDYLYVCECGNTWTNFVRRSAARTAMTALCLMMLCTNAFAQDGFATYYTRASVLAEGNSGITASGEKLDESALTCALPKAKFGSEWLVYSPDSNKAIVVRCNDRGPGKGPQSRNVIIDLTPEGMRQLGIKGKAPVSIQEVQS